MNTLKKSMNIWEFISSRLKNDCKLVLLVVIDNKGSSPGKKGFKMAVSNDGKLSGSVGGGQMEFEMVELARKQFEKPSEIFLKKQIHNSSKDEDSSGMMCSGTQWIAFYNLDSTYLPLSESIRKSKSGRLVFNESGFVFNRELSSNSQFSSLISDKEHWSLTERLGFNDFLYIFGGGHVSVELSLIFKRLGFHISVLDNRDEYLTTYKQNVYANSKKIINYKKVAKYIPEGDNVYVVIMSFGHKSDMRILKQLLDKKIKYLGMMGSKTKVAVIFKKLLAKGYAKEALDKVDAPIGLDINSNTPTEIAVSIAGKIIKVKNSGN
ncbi:MAG: XdhC family protein [Chlorobi bacterium]|nr:XdhC family protein [Chlorobiota bacterium]